jgi:hypothetical protein
MYDTVNFWIDRYLVGNYNLSTIATCLNGISEHQSDRGYFINGSLNNLKVNIYESGVSIKGSLAKFHLTDNLHTLTRSGTHEAIEHLSDVLNLPIDKAKITAIDLATHFIMKYPPNSYYSFLGSKKYFNRLQASTDTLYYNTKPKQLIFYDKSIEATAKKVDIPIIYKDINLLRYELRHKGRLNKQFNMPEFTGATLYNERFYIDIINLWVKEYMNIQKIQRFTLQNIDNMKTPNDAIEMIFGMYLLKAGQSEIDSILNDLKAKKAFPDPKYYSRVKSKLNSIMNKPEITEKSDLIKELDQNVKQIKLYYR